LAITETIFVLITKLTTDTFEASAFETATISGLSYGGLGTAAGGVYVNATVVKAIPAVPVVVVPDVVAPGVSVPHMVPLAETGHAYPAPRSSSEAPGSEPLGLYTVADKLFAAAPGTTLMPGPETVTTRIPAGFTGKFAVPLKEFERLEATVTVTVTTALTLEGGVYPMV
jgi:hypothetical protein